MPRITIPEPRALAPGVEPVRIDDLSIEGLDALITRRVVDGWVELNAAVTVHVKRRAVGVSGTAGATFDYWVISPESGLATLSASDEIALSDGASSGSKVATVELVAYAQAVPVPGHCYLAVTFNLQSRNGRGRVWPDDAPANDGALMRLDLNRTSLQTWRR